MRISLYTFEDAEGNEFGTYNTQKASEAESYARANNLRVIDNIYEWEESVPVPGWDFTGTN